METKNQYSRENEDLFAAEIFSTCQPDGQPLPESLFNQYLDDFKPNITHSDEEIPSVLIDGGNFDCQGYYMIKLSHDDPKGAILRFLFNHTISDSVGIVSAAIGMISEYSGFYVLCQGEVPQSGDTKKIALQNILGYTWAWKGQKNTIVLDQMMSHSHLDKATITRLFNLLGRHLVEKNNIRQVNICSNKTSRALFPYEQSTRAHDVRSCAGFSTAYSSKPQIPIYSHISKYRGINTCEQLDSIQLQVESMDSEWFNKNNNAGYPPLHLAIQMGDVNLARVMIERTSTSTLMQRLPAGMTLLHIAIQLGQVQIALMLLERIPIEARMTKNKQGMTPLHFACREGHADLAAILIQHTSPDSLIKPCMKGMTCLQLAIDGMHKEIIALILCRVDLGDRRTKKGSYGETLYLPRMHHHGTTSLILAVKYLDIDQFKQVISHFVALRSSSLQCNTALSIAICREDPAIFDLLIDACNNVSGGYILTPDIQILYKAIKDDNLGFVKKLLPAQLDKTWVGPQQEVNGHVYKRKLFQKAVANNKIEILEYLLERFDNISLNLISKHEHTILHTALYRGHPDIALILLNKIDPELLLIKDDLGKTPLEVALSNENLTVIADRIRDKMSKLGQPNVESISQTLIISEGYLKLIYKQRRVDGSNNPAASVAKVQENNAVSPMQQGHMRSPTVAQSSSSRGMHTSSGSVSLNNAEGNQELRASEFEHDRPQKDTQSRNAEVTSPSKCTIF